MRYFPLIWAAIWRKPLRTMFTLFSVAIAFYIFGVLESINVGYARVLDEQRMDRLLVDPRFDFPIPFSYADQIEKIDGVLVVTRRGSIPTFYQDQKNYIFSPAIDSNFWLVRPEMHISKEDLAKFERTPTGAVVTKKLAEKYGWKIGDKIPLQSTVLQKSGSNIWTYDVVSIIDDGPGGPPNGIMFTNYSYLDEARAADRGTLTRIALLIKDPKRAGEISRQIDDLFANSPAPTTTAPERTMVQGYVDSFIDIGFFTKTVIGSAMFMLLFLTANVMMQSVRERIPEFAVLKTVGFTHSGVFAIVIAEALLICIFGAGLGLAVASVSAFLVVYIEALRLSAGFLPVVTAPVFFAGFSLAVGLGLLSAFPPALRAKNLNVVNALANR